MTSTTMIKPATQAPAQPAPLFKLGAQYLIAPDADTLALLDDFRLLFERGMDAIETEIDTFTGAQWAGVYAMRQAWGVFEQIEARTRAIAHQTKP